MHSIITIDGGGIMGIIPCIILEYIEQKIQDYGDDSAIRLADCVDFFAGTSTGGIMCLALSTPNQQGRPLYSVSELIDFYVNSGPEIFDVNLWRQLSTGFGLRNSKFTDDKLKSTMRHYFHDHKLSAAITPTLVTAYDINAQQPLYFRSYEARYNNAHDYWTRDAAVATASAPTYFPLAEIESINGNKRLCVDGVMIAHNPSMIAYAEFKKMARGINVTDMNLISLGTGYQLIEIDNDEDKNWGTMDWGSRFADIMVDGNSKNVDALLSQVFAEVPHNYSRISPQLTSSVIAELDCSTPENIQALIDNGKHYVASNQRQLDHIAKRFYDEAFHPESRVFFKGLGIDVQPFWVSNYPQNVNPIINVKQYTNLIEMMDEASQRYADQIAYRSQGAELSFNQVKRYAEQIAYWLQSQSLQRSDRVAIMLPNCLSYPVIFQAIIKAGVIAVNINPQFTSHELDQIIDDSGLKILFVWEDAVHRLQQCKHYDLIDSVVVCKTTDYFPAIKALAIDIYNQYLSIDIPKYRRKNYVFLTAIIQKTKDKYPFGIPVANEDIALLQYTGATTGKPKGVMITHQNMVANVIQIKEFTDPELFAEDAQLTIITALPLYHIYGLTINSVFSYTQGMMNLLISDPQDTDSIIKVFKKYPVNFISGVDALFKNLMAHARFVEIDWSPLKTTLAGGMATSQTTATNWFNKTGKHILQGYGLTEASPCVTASSYQQGEFNGSVGMPLPSTLVMICDELSNPLPNGELGEIYVNGPQVMKGYWRESKDIASRALLQRWLKTGDVGYFDKRGNLYIVGRSNDRIITSGLHIYPSEIESILNQHPAILESACIGIADNSSGEVIKAFVVKQPTLEVDTTSLINWCKNNLIDYQIPKIIQFVDELPKSNLGKILRQQLREA